MNNSVFVVIYLINMDEILIFSEDGKKVIGTCDKSVTHVTIPNGVTIIEQGAFRDCSLLQSIDIPNSVTTIESGAFGGCNNILSQIKSDIIQRFGKEVFDS